MLDEVSVSANRFPSLTQFYFLDRYGKIIEDIKRIKAGETEDIFIKAVFLGVDAAYTDYNEPGEGRNINFCLYESNNTGKGYRIIDLKSYHLSIEEMHNERLEIETRLVTVDNNLKPYHDEWEGYVLDNVYNYRRTYLALKIFFSREEIPDLIMLEQLFFSTRNVVLDTKLPFEQVI